MYCNCQHSQLRHGLAIIIIPTNKQPLQPLPNPPLHTLLGRPHRLPRNKNMRIPPNNLDIVLSPLKYPNLVRNTRRTEFGNTQPQIQEIGKGDGGEVVAVG